jgi:N-acetylglucosamine kinase-like BadF-type ATPase
LKSEQLVLGIDGGGTKTAACLALRESGGEASIVGRGYGGPSNAQTLGLPAALQSLDCAVDEALRDASVSRGPVAAACLGLAGADRESVATPLAEWAAQRQLANSLRIVHDGLPVLAAGTPDGWGVALIAGTGSFAFGMDAAGRSARAGGWGHLFGDEGSGYAIALAGLRAAAQAADGRGPATQLVDRLLGRLSLSQPMELIPAIYGSSGDRAAIASLAEVVVGTAAAGDPVAEQLVCDAAEELARMVSALAVRLDLSDAPCPLALAGGALLHGERLQQRLRESLSSMSVHAEPIASVAEPVLGAVRLARDWANQQPAERSS